MQGAAVAVIGAGVLLFFYTYFGYPALLWCVGLIRPRVLPSKLDSIEPESWPRISVSVPAYNEEDQIEGLIESLLAIDYPRDRMQILITSDASTDRTDEIVRRYRGQGIELLRLDERGGKTKAESAASEQLSGDIIVNTDASIRIDADALKALMRVFSDSEIGCASGRDVSVGEDSNTANVGESGYVGYEMSVRDLETRVDGIVGASGCFYAIRANLHRLPLPESLSRDFAAALHTRENGYRPVSVNDAVCLVPRSPSLRKEYQRKVRTITRGMRTLAYKRQLMNPLRFGWFSWMLVSHKVCRWALPWAAAASLVALGALAVEHRIAAAFLAVSIVIGLLGWVGWLRAEEENVPKVFSVPAFAIAGNVAAAHAFLRALRGARDALWEPTRRDVVKAP